MLANQNGISGTRSSARNRTQSARARGDDPLSTLVRLPQKSDALAPSDNHTPDPPSVVQSRPKPLPPAAPVEEVSLVKKKRIKKVKNARKGPPPSLVLNNDVHPRLLPPIQSPPELSASPAHPTPPSPIISSLAGEVPGVESTPVTSVSSGPDPSSAHTTSSPPSDDHDDDHEGSSNKENDPPVPPQKDYDAFDSPVTDDDYGLTKDLKRRQNANKPRPSPTTSDSDQELDEEFVNETQPSPVASPASSPVTGDVSDDGSDSEFENEFEALLEQFKNDYVVDNGGDSEVQGVEVDTEGDDEDVAMDGVDGDIEDCLDEDPNSTRPYKAGPLSDIAKETADTIFKTCIDSLEALAKQEGKSTKMIYQHVGLNIVSPRGRNNWNLYLMHLRANHGEKFAHLNRVQWTKAALRRYRKFLVKADAGEGREKAFAPIVGWYNSRLLSHINNQNKNGKMGKLTMQLLKPFIDLAVKVYQNTGIEVFGYAINTERDSKGGSSSVSWGGTPGFLEVRAENEPNVMKTLQDLETMFHMRNINQASKSSKPELVVVGWDQKGCESVRDRDSRVLKEYARKDSVMILVARADGGLDERAKVLKSRFPWSGVLDFMYQKHMRLVGWPEGYTETVYQIENLPSKTRRDLAQRRKDYEDGKCDEVGVLRVVPWTADEISLSEQDLNAASTIPLIQDAAGTDLRCVMHSSAYINDIDQLGGVKSRKMKTMKATSKSTSGSHSRTATTAAPPSTIPIPVDNSLGSPFTLSGDYEGLSEHGGSVFSPYPPATPTFRNSLENDGANHYIHTPSSSPPLEAFGDQDNHSQPPNAIFMSPLPPPQSSLRNYDNRLVPSRGPNSHSTQGATQRLSHLLSQPARAQPTPRPASHQSNNHRDHVAHPRVDPNTNRSTSAFPQAHSSRTGVNPLVRSRSPAGMGDDDVRTKRQKLQQDLRSYTGSDMASKQLRAALRAEIDQLDNRSLSGAVTTRPRPRQVQPASTSFTPFEAQFATPGPSQQNQTQTTGINRNTSQRGVGPQRNGEYSCGGFFIRSVVVPEMEESSHVCFGALLWSWWDPQISDMGVPTRMGASKHNSGTSKVMGPSLELHIVLPWDFQGQKELPKWYLGGGLGSPKRNGKTHVFDPP
ncbi:hypothetical protein BDN72DRAFT_863428 [Pluteus cervinus]|uniref:Uncharacterized protein n=1 Tax=Pluteus cervinus TaxID=181527 RepID=A0ACD3A7I8_9AGAR|nr:hypothetical protein BDN72DRAFT_863428 [Pluteus cervinus]